MYQQKKPSKPEGGIASIHDDKVSMAKEVEGGMSTHEDESIGNRQILSEEDKVKIISDTKGNTVQRKSLAEIISETNLLSDAQCGNGLLSSSKELDGDCGITIPSDLDSISPILFNLDQTIPNIYLNSDSTTCSESHNVLSEAEQHKWNMSKENEQSTDVIINVDSASDQGTSKKICSQSTQENSVILIESSQEEIADMPNQTEDSNSQSAPFENISR